jgi:hypothetical protein
MSTNDNPGFDSSRSAYASPIMGDYVDDVVSAPSPEVDPDDPDSAADPALHAMGLRRVNGRIVSDPAAAGTQRRGRLGGAEVVPDRSVADGATSDAPGEPASVATKPSQGFTLETPARDDDWTGDVQAFGAVAPGLGLNQEQAQQLLDLVAEQTPGITSTMLDRDPRDGAIVGWKEDHVRAHLRSVWGAEYEENLTAVHKAVAARGQGFADWLDASGAGNNPAVLQLLAAAGRNPELMNPAKARAFIQKTMSDAQSPSYKKYWAGDKQTVFEMRLAHQFATDTTMSPAELLAQSMRRALSQ